MHDWQDIYTILDVEKLFENHVVELNLNEVHFLDNSEIVSLQAVSSGVGIGHCNWKLSVKAEDHLQNYGIITNMCLEGDYRYPLGIDTSCLVGVDCLLMSSNVIVPEMIDFNLNKPIEQRISYSTQIFQLLSRLNEILNSSPNAKVLMPVQPTFLLELVDLLLHKLNDQV